jgi:hypothetical protein
VEDPTDVVLVVDDFVPQRATADHMRLNAAIDQREVTAGSAR